MPKAVTCKKHPFICGKGECVVDLLEQMSKRSAGTPPSDDRTRREHFSLPGFSDLPKQLDQEFDKVASKYDSKPEPLPRPIEGEKKESPVADSPAPSES